MKLIAEIATLPSEGDVDRSDSYPVRLSLEGDDLTVEARLGADAVCFELSLNDVTQALRALAPAMAQTAHIPGLRRIDLVPDAGHDAAGHALKPPAPTRDASGARIGISPRFAMRAVKPEANVEEPDDDGETAA